MKMMLDLNRNAVVLGLLVLGGMTLIGMKILALLQELGLPT